MAHDLLIRGGTVVTPSGEEHLDIAVDDEQIVELASPGSAGDAVRTIDATDKIVMPGLMDPHVHFGVGDDIAKWTDELMMEDFFQNTRDALLGGYTTIATTTQIGNRPLMDYYARTLQCGTIRSWCDFKITSLVNTRDQINEIPQIARHGGVDFKFFTGYIGIQAEEMGMDPKGITPDFFFLACEAMSRADSYVFAKIHAEDPYVRGLLVDRLRTLGHDASLVAWAETTPEWAESLQVYTYGLIAHELNVPFYPVHISSAHTTEMVKQLKAQGWNITGETLSMYLCTTAPEMDERQMGAKAKIQPPVRFDRDRDRLWQGIREGTITLVGTDSHAFSRRFKEGVDFWHCMVGINIQLADALALLYHSGVAAGRVTPAELSRVTSENAARMYGLFPTKGAIQVGADADLVLFDPERELTLGTHRYKGTNDYSLWEGETVRGAPVMTILRGTVVVEDDEIVIDAPCGRLAMPRGSRQPDVAML